MRKKSVLLLNLERLGKKVIKIAHSETKNRTYRHLLCQKVRGRAEIFLLSDEEMRRLKKKFLPREKGPANVLSFGEPASWPHPEKGKRRLGEIYLNADLTGGKTKNLIPLLIHGILHILGYDHKKKSDRMKMEKLERKVLETLDIRH